MSLSKLRQLANIISEQVDAIEARMAEKKMAYPDLDNAMSMPPDPAEFAILAPEIMLPSLLIVSACGQLSASVKLPSLTMVDAFHGFHVPACLRTVFALNVVEILREAGPKGLDVHEIAKKTGKPVEPQMLARILRVLATNHIFREVSPNIFANNRLSSLADTGKSSTKLVTDGVAAKYSNVQGMGAGMSALVEHTLEEGFKSSYYLCENVINHEKTSPFTKAFDKPLYFQWLDEPDNLGRKVRFDVAMEGTQSVEPPKSMLTGFDWGSLSEGSLVVDIGGGLGHIASDIVTGVNGRLKFVVQDRPAVVANAEEFWQSPERVKYRQSGVVELQGHDFFAPQPIKTADVFLLRMILHDWPDDEAKAILKQLRDAATPKTKLMIVEQVLPYACEDTTEASKVEGYKALPAPAPLLPNLGRANVVAYWLDVHMHNLFRGKERTLADFIELGKATGWKVTQMYDLPGSIFKQVVAVPMTQANL